MNAPTERQVLYALVSTGFLLVVGVLTVVAWSTGLSPGWWSLTMAVMWVAASVYCAMRWRQTGRILTISIVSFLIWTVGTLSTL